MATRHRDGFFKLKKEEVKTCLEERYEHYKTSDGPRKARAKMLQQLQQLRTAMYVMCGGSFLARFGTDQPADFYIDLRCGTLPYKRKQIEQVALVLETYAEVLGLNPHNLSSLDNPFEAHNCGVW